ncbi:MAG: flagellar motor protein MotB [Mariprofundaceae bacterium]|nr:flagellar motor protein MotB [Mariprofundaceae bacterium]
MVRKKKQEPEVLPDPEAWMTTFADLISLMLTFFILLVSMSTLDKTGLSDISTSFRKAVSVLSAGEKTEMQMISPFQLQRIVKPRELMLALRQNSRKVLQHSTLEHKINAVVLNNRLILRMKDAVLFAPGQAKLNTVHAKALKRLARMLASSPGSIRVEGHTDTSKLPANSPYPDPWSLSLARAASVLHMLEREGVNPYRLSLAGYGPSRPISTEATPYGRARNRRVDIVLYEDDITD